jgi:competence protein ComEC
VAALGIGLAWWRLDHGPRSRALGGLALGLGTGALTLALWPLMRPPDGRLHVAVLDVGQGDAIVIRAPDGRTAVVDAGPGGPYRLDTGERVVAPFLWNHGVQRLAATLVTHADVDHAGGMRAVHRLFNVDERWDRATLAAGPRWLGGVQVTLVHPRAVPTPSGALPSGAGRSTHRNAEAIVLRLDLGLVSVLLASDIGAAQEHALVAANTPLAATVLKVAHHGAASSSTPAFLRSVRPAVAVLSVGARNTYRHPDPAVLGRLAESGASLYRTDRDGGVVLETDGRVLTVTRTVGGATDRYCVDPDTLC